MILQRKSKRSGWVSKYKGLLVVTGKKDIGDAIAYTLKKTAMRPESVTKLAIDR